MICKMAAVWNEDYLWCRCWLNKYLRQYIIMHRLLLKSGFPLWFPVYVGEGAAASPKLGKTNMFVFLSNSAPHLFRWKSIDLIQGLVGCSLLASLDGGARPDTVDSICHIVWLLINLNVSPTKPAVAGKWSNSKAQRNAANAEAKALESPNPPTPPVLTVEMATGCTHTHTQTPPPPPACLLLSYVSSQIWCSGGRVRGRGCTGIIKPTWINRTAPSLSSKAFSWGGA